MSFDAGTEASASCDTCNAGIYDGEVIHCGECAVPTSGDSSLASQLDEWLGSNSLLITKGQRLAVETTLALLTKGERR